MANAVFEAPATRVAPSVVADDMDALGGDAGSAAATTGGHGRSGAPSTPAAAVLRSPASRRKLGSLNIQAAGSTPPDSPNFFKSPSWRGAMPIEGVLWVPKNLATGDGSSKKKVRLHWCVRTATVAACAAL